MVPSHGSNCTHHHDRLPHQDYHKRKRKHQPSIFVKKYDRENTSKKTRARCRKGNEKPRSHDKLIDAFSPQKTISSQLQTLKVGDIEELVQPMAHWSISSPTRTQPNERLIPKHHELLLLAKADDTCPPGETSDTPTLALLSSTVTSAATQAAKCISSINSSSRNARWQN